MNVVFEEPEYAQPAQRMNSKEKRSWPTELVLKLKLAKDEKGAERVLIIVAALAILAALALFILPALTAPSPAPPPP